PENGVGEIRSGLVGRDDSVESRGRTGAEAGELGKDEPHPVILLRPRADFIKDRVEIAALSIDKALKIEGVGHTGIMGLWPPAEKSGSRLSDVARAAPSGDRRRSSPGRSSGSTRRSPG